MGGRAGHLFAWDIPEEYGTRTWRDAEGVFAPLSGRAYRAFFEGDEPWPGVIGEGRFVCMASIVVEMKDRKPGLIIREYFTRHRVLENGHLDEQWWSKGQGTKSELIVAEIDPRGDHTDRFAGRRLRNLYGWAPTERDVAALVQLLERRGLVRISV